MDAEKLDAVGKALGFALAVYDQTQPGALLDRIVATRSTLETMSEDGMFSPDVDAVMEGVCAGLHQYTRMVLADQSGIDSSPGHVI